MSSLVVREMQLQAAQVRSRLRNPPNSVRDFGIDLKRKVIPIVNAEKSQIVPITSLDVFGPRHPSIDDLAFGPIVHARPLSGPIRIEEVQRAVAKKFGISRLELLSTRRTKDVVRPRHIAIYIAKRLTTQSLPAIGRAFGGQDHTTVLHAVRKIETERLDNLALHDALCELESALVSARTSEA